MTRSPSFEKRTSDADEPWPTSQLSCNGSINDGIGSIGQAIGCEILLYILLLYRKLSLRYKNKKRPMKSLDSREVTNEITGFFFAKVGFHKWLVGVVTNREIQ